MTDQELTERARMLEDSDLDSLSRILATERSQRAKDTVVMKYLRWIREGRPDLGTAKIN